MLLGAGHHLPGGASGGAEHLRGDQHHPQHRHQPALLQLRRHSAADAAGADGHFAEHLPAARMWRRPEAFALGESPVLPGWVLPAAASQRGGAGDMRERKWVWNESFVHRGRHGGAHQPRPGGGGVPAAKGAGRPNPLRGEQGRHGGAPGGPGRLRHEDRARSPASSGS